MGASSSIDMVLPTHIHLCIPVRAIKNKCIESIQTYLTEQNISTTNTHMNSKETETHVLLKNASMVIIFLSEETPKSFLQAQEIDFVKKEYRKVFYILLDVKYNQKQWIRDFIGKDEWLEYDNNSNIEKMTTKIMDQIL
jgi:hypothetical protein